MRPNPWHNPGPLDDQRDNRIVALQAAVGASSNHSMDVTFTSILNAARKYLKFLNGEEGE